MRTPLAAILCIAMSAFAGEVSAKWFGKDFSATAVQTGPNQSPVTGTMHVSDGRVRTEMVSSGKRQIQIIDPQLGKIWMLQPQEKVYVELPLPPSARSAAANSDLPPPCLDQGNVCEQVARETLNGRGTIKWQLTARGRDNSPTLIWTDANHGFPVREQVDGRVIAAMHYLGRESVNGRNTEKWIRAVQAQNGREMSSTQWYDPELNIAIRQELPGGFVRELREITIGPQSPALFEIPAGFKRAPAPAFGSGPVSGR